MEERKKARYDAAKYVNYVCGKIIFFEVAIVYACYFKYCKCVTIVSVLFKTLFPKFLQ